jgi:hypothetical protein
MFRENYYWSNVTLLDAAQLIEIRGLQLNKDLMESKKPDS